MKVGVISDIHANIHALRVVLSDLDREKVDTILVAGDLIGYYYWPSEVVKLLMEDKRFLCIRGNHEDILSKVLEDDVEAERYRSKYGSGYDICKERLSDVQIKWLESLPSEMSITLNKVTFYLSHGSLCSTEKYLYPDAPLTKMLKNYSDAKYTIYGHTHYPFLHEYSGRFLINPGSVGQPRDSGGLASYVIIDTENNSVRFKRKAFNSLLVISEVAKKDPSLSYLSEIMERQ